MTRYYFVLDPDGLPAPEDDPPEESGPDGVVLPVPEVLLPELSGDMPDAPEVEPGEPEVVSLPVLLLLPELGEP